MKKSLYWIYIGVGHGGDDPGACANGFKEKDLNLKVAKACYDHLKANGVSAIISRTSDVTESVNTKASEADNNGCTHVVDIHFNAGGGDGAEVLYMSNDGKTMGNNILNEIKALGQNSRGVKYADDKAMLRDTNGIANIVECAFIDNGADMTIADTDSELKNMGVAIAKGIMVTIGMNSSNPPTETAPPENSSEVAPIPTLKKGSEGNEVEKLQKYIHAKSDGDFGSNTEQALRNWQKVYGLTSDGIYGSKSQAKMQDVIDGKAKKVYVPTIPTPTLEVGSHGQEVEELQVIINTKVDGDFGSNTEQALRNWQKVYDLESDGVYGPLTEDKMKEVY